MNVASRSACRRITLSATITVETLERGAGDGSGRVRRCFLSSLRTDTHRRSYLWYLLACLLTYALVSNSSLLVFLHLRINM